MGIFQGISLALQALAFLPLPTNASPQYHKSVQLNNRQTKPCVNSPTNRGCWGDYDLSTNYYDTVPDTGVTREYWLEVTNTTLAPDGVERIVLAVNGTLPGPTIEADWGDTVIVHLTNHLANNGSSFHFHGIRQNLTVQNDGVPSVTQCPVAPGGTYTYTWRATQYGSSWYHSHYSLQAWDGVFGGIQINGPTTANYDTDLGLLIIQDWSHVTATSQFTYDETVGPPTQDTGLINGTNMWQSSGAYFEQTFISGTSYKLRIVNVAIDTFFKFSIDGHTMTVVAMDFVPIEPFETTILSMGNAQRYDVIVNATEPVGDYWIRAIPQVSCSENDNVNGILGIIRYDSASTANPTTIGYPYNDSCSDMPAPSLVPYLALNVGSETVEEDLEVSVGLNATTGIIYWYVAGSSMYLDWSNPTLLQVDDGVTNFATQENVYEVTEAGSWTYVVLEQSVAAAHPIHFHGHDFYVLAQGTGTYASSNTTLQTTNPPRRDVAMLNPEGFLVIAFKADNPGTWLMHCHIGWHQSLGLDLQFVEQYDKIGGLIDNSTLTETCAGWETYLNESGLKQSDDGV